MSIRATLVLGMLAVFSIAPAIASAQQPKASGETVTLAFRHAIPNVPGKSIVGVVVRYPPGGKSRPHHHAPSAFITAYVLSGAIRSQVNNQPERMYRTGESWTEPPGAFHRVSENASPTEPASLLAIFIVDSNEKNLTTSDRSK